jgi:hypothetical protein
MPRLAHLATELRLTGAGQLAIGIGGLAWGLGHDLELGRGLGLFGASFAVVGALTLWAARPLERMDPPEAPPSAELEENGATLRRAMAGLVLPAVAMVVCVLLGEGLAALVGGVIAAVGAVDLRALLLVLRREAAGGGALWRALPDAILARGRRPVYLVPRSD